MPARLGPYVPRSLASRLFIGGVLVIATVLALVFVILSRWAQRSGDAVVQRELEQSADLVAQFLAGRQRSLTGGARVFVQGPYFRAIVAENRRDDIIDQTFEAVSQLDADWVFIVDERGVLLAKSDEPSASGVDLGGVPLVAGALQGRVTSGFGVSRDSLLFQAVAVPIVVPGAAPLGALVATKIVDAALARDVKAATSAEIVFYVSDDGGPRIAATSFDRALRAPLSAEVAAQTRSHALVNRVRYATQGAAVTTAGGEIVGGYVVMSARDAASAEIAEVRRALLLSGLFGLVLLALGAVALDRRVSRPLRELASVARSAELGGDATSIGAARSTREVGSEVESVTQAVRSLADDVRDRATLSAAVSAALPGVARLQAGSAAISAAAPALSMVRVHGASSRPIAASPSRATDPVRGEGAAGEAAVGDMLAGRYRIESVLGTGDFGITYRARDRVAGETVALRRLRSARLGAESTSIVEALREAIRGPQRVVHRNVIRLRDAGEDAGAPFVTMDYVEGVSLATLLRASGPLTDDAVLAIAKQLCRALAAAEAQAVVHGSLAPRQILLGYDGILKVGDFALAQLERRARGGRGARGGGNGRDTEQVAKASEVPQLAGATVGTPEYMSPEQLIGEEPSFQADLYAAGVVLYECVTGATPFRTDSPLAFLAQKLGNADNAGDTTALRASRPSRSRSTQVLREVIARMIAPEVTRRARSAGELLAMLERAG
ncbi:MAG TPA: serine/threonine-protein kinase [Gemmatimonadaceae bacterium]|nr:serine/threonine-protein kinase [Gemmatimonadaceae bacterium]